MLPPEVYKIVLYLAKTALDSDGYFCNTTEEEKERDLEAIRIFEIFVENTESLFGTNQR
jgi:hypothetical protein